MGKNDTRRLLNALRAKGFTVREAGNVWIIRFGDEFVAAMSTSSTDLRALKNALHMFRGLDLDADDPDDGQ